MAASTRIEIGDSGIQQILETALAKENSYAVSIGDLYDLQFTKDAADFMPHQTTDFRRVGNAMLAEKSTHVEIQTPLGVRVEARDQKNKIAHTNSFHSE